MDTLCQSQCMQCTKHTCLARFDRIILVMDRTCRACQIVDLIYLDVDRFCHIMSDKFKIWISHQMSDIIF